MEVEVEMKIGNGNGNGETSCTPDVSVTRVLMEISLEATDGTFLRYSAAPRFARLANMILLRKPGDFSECGSVWFYSIRENASEKHEQLSKEMNRFALVRAHGDR